MATSTIESPKTELIAGGGMEIVPLGVIGPSPSYSSKTLTFTDNVRALLAIISGTPSQCGLYTIYGGNNSSTTSKALSESNTVTITGHATGTTGAGTLTIESTAALRGYLLVLEGNGGFSVS